MSEIPNINPEATFIGPEGEKLTVNEYIRWELEEILRYTHEISATAGLEVKVQRPQGLLMAIASRDHAHLTIPEIAAGSLRSDLKAMEANLEGLVQAGILTARERHYGGGNEYSLAISDLSWLEAHKSQEEERERRQAQKRAARREGHAGLIGKLLRSGDS